tara:strand:+ start:8720 stop:9514 length:795 start_codon:yes stop_codon:yes gene_type:complete
VKKTKSNRRKVIKKAQKLPKPNINWTRALVPICFLSAFSALILGGRFLLDHPVRQIEIKGSFQRVTPIQVEAVIVSALTGGFLSANLNELQYQVEGLDWVESAQVTRSWPDRLKVRVIEHRAAARWGSSGLLNSQGILFTENARYMFPELPHLMGPKGTEEEVAKRYLSLRARLAEANFTLESLVMDERGAWQIKLESGQQIRIGKRDVDERLDRLFKVVAPSLADQFDRIQHVDLRYSNGFSVGWASIQETLQTEQSEALGNG